MKQFTTITKQDTAKFEEILGKLADECRENGNIRTFLVAMAATMEREAGLPENNDKLPRAPAVKDVMEAVKLIMTGDQSMDAHLLKTLINGTVCVENWITNSPQFDSIQE